MNNKRYIEELDSDVSDVEMRPEFMTPRPVSPRKSKANFTYSSILGKRKFNETFDSSTFDDDRYSQHISIDFFKNNTGHGVLQDIKLTEEQEEILKWCEQFQERRQRDSETKYDPEEIMNWCEKYLAIKKNI